MATLSELINRIRYDDPAIGDNLRGHIANAIDIVSAGLDTSIVGMMADAAVSTPWFVFDSANLTIRIGAEVYAITSDNARLDVTATAHPGAIAYSISKTATQAFVYNTTTSTPQCIPYMDVGLDQLVLFHFNGRPGQIITPRNFTRSFPYQVDGIMYNV